MTPDEAKQIIKKLSDIGTQLLAIAIALTAIALTLAWKLQ